MRIYLDVCCLNRPFDDQRQERVRLEAEAVLTILRRVEAGVWELAGGDVIDFETGRMPDLERRQGVRALADLARRSGWPTRISSCSLLAMIVAVPFVVRAMVRAGRKAEHIKL